MVIGIDFGNDTCYISVAKQGGIEPIYNDYSLRETPSYVGFGDRQRFIGVGAKNQLLTNLQKTVFGFKHILGRKYHDLSVLETLKDLPFECSEGPDGRIMIQVDYFGDSMVRNRQSFSPVQITAMLFTKLKITAETALNTKVKSAVISCPCYFTNAQRHALQCAGKIAGLNVLKIMNDTSAAALAYGIYKNDLPLKQENPRNVVFVDVGHIGVQASACSFHSGKMEIKSSVYATGLGGKAFDEELVNYFAVEFEKKNHLDIRKNRKSVLKLTAEVEKLKKQMSSNANDLPLNIECLIEEKDFRSSINREKFENLIQERLNCLEKTLYECLASSEWKKDAIHSVEVIGGCSRIPAIKNSIERVFGLLPSFTINADEGISRGCALQCAMLSPAFKVREFAVKDIQLFPIVLSWEVDRRIEEMIAFPRFHPVPCIKQLKFYRQSDICISADYDIYKEKLDIEQGNENMTNLAQCLSNPFIGSYHIGKINPGLEGKPQKIKVEIAVDESGIFGITSAIMIDNSGATQDISLESNNSDFDSNDTNLEKIETYDDLCDIRLSDQTSKETSINNRMTKRVQLNVTAQLVSYISSLELSGMVELESKFVKADTAEKERLEAKNEVEEYIYKIRQNAQDVSLLTEDEQWLYQDGNDCDISSYIDKINELKLYERQQSETS